MNRILQVISLLLSLPLCFSQIELFSQHKASNDFLLDDTNLLGKGSFYGGEYTSGSIPEGAVLIENSLDLPTSYLSLKTYSFIMSEETNGIRFYNINQAIGDRNKGRLSIGTLCIYYYI